MACSGDLARTILIIIAAVNTLCCCESKNLSIFDLHTARVGNFRQKNNFAEDGIDGTMFIYYGVPVVPRNRKSRNSVPNPSAEEKITRNSVPWNKNRSKLQ